ncbi:MAG: hypothetical protein MJK18_05630 [Bdellovibrionales bacterium]|nr:hypothetical protein [Bdellovibrionales bacterium]
MKLYVALFCSVGLMACSSKMKEDMGFNRGALVDKISSSEFVGTEVSDLEIKEALKKNLV